MEYSRHKKRINQETGDKTTQLMSQKAITEAIRDLALDIVYVGSSREFTINDNNKLLVITNHDVTLTAPANLPTGFSCYISNPNLTPYHDAVEAGLNVYVYSKNSIKDIDSNGVVRIICTQRDAYTAEYVLTGDLDSKVDKIQVEEIVTANITVNNADNHSGLFIVPAAQAAPIVITLESPSTTGYFYFTIKNKSSQAVTFSDGSNPIVDAYGFGSVTQGGLVTVLWDGNEWMISGGLD